MNRRYAADSDLLSEFKTHLALGQWEVVEAFVTFQLDRDVINDLLRGVALQPHLNSYCLQQNVRSPEHLSFLAARCIGDDELSKDAAFRSTLRGVTQLGEDIKFHLLDSFTHGIQPEQRVLNALRQCCLLPQVPISLFVILDLLRLPQVPLECILQICVQLQQASSAWSVDQLIEKLQELVAFTPPHETVPAGILRDIANSMVEHVLPRRPDKLLSMAIGCQHKSFQKELLGAISEKECILSRARALGKHFLELHLDETIAALKRNEKLPENLPGLNLRPLALQFAWNQLPPEAVFNRLDELERLYADDEMISRLAEIVRECRLISSVTKNSLLDLVAQRQTQSLLRVVHSTGALKGMKDAQVLHIVKDEYQSHMLRGYLILKHACSALFHAALIAERRVDRNAVFRPRTQEDLIFESTKDIVEYIDLHGPDVSFDTLVTQELAAMSSILGEVPSNALKVEVLENLFSLLFVTHRDLQQNGESSDEENDAVSSTRFETSEEPNSFLKSSGFLASKEFISALLIHLDKHIRSTKLKFSDERALQSRLEELLKHVVDARWRLEIVEEKLLLSIKCVQNIEAEDASSSSSSSLSTPPRTRRRSARQRTKSHTAHLEPRAPQATVIELMLSTMDALMRHCLWKSSYERAKEVRQAVVLKNSEMADSAELDFCLSISSIEEEVLSLQTDPENISAIFVAIESFLQARPLTANSSNLSRFYLNLAFISGLRPFVAYKLLAHSTGISREASSAAYPDLQAIHRSGSSLYRICEKLADTEIPLEETLQLSTSHLDGETLREELLFWSSLEKTIEVVGNLLNMAHGSANTEVHQEFFRLAKMTGTGIRKFHRRLPSYNFDFLRALYAHARQVYKALEEKQHTLRAHVGPQHRTYFSVLEECSPSMTLLKLILHDHVPPNKLEEFAVKMKLNITQCVSKEILPNIYMRPMSLHDFPYLRVLNCDMKVTNSTHKPSQTQISRNAAFVAKKLLSQIIDILGEKTAGKLLIEKYDGLREIAFSAQYDRWRESTRELINIDPTKLKTEERIPFFLNVIHCLTLDRLLFKCKRGQPFVTNVLESQIDDSLYAYEIGHMGTVSLLGLKYSILFRGHSLPELKPPLLSLAKVPDYGFLPPANMLTIFSLVQGFQDDPPLRVLETETQLQEGFSRAVLKINVDVENKKMYVPWQTKEIMKGKFFRSNEKQVLQLTILKMGGSGFSIEFVKPQKFRLNLNPFGQCSDLCERQRSTKLDVPPSVLRYMEQHCSPIGAMLNPAVETASSALDRILEMLPEAKKTALSGTVAEDIWDLLEASTGWSDPLSRMLQCIDLCEAISGGEVSNRKLSYLKHLIIGELAKTSYRYVLRIEADSVKVDAFLANYMDWNDKDIEVSSKALKSLVAKTEPRYKELTTEIERIYLYQSIGRLLNVEWRTIPRDIPQVIEKLRSTNRFDFVHKISMLSLVDERNELLQQVVTELNACYYFSQTHEEDYVSGLRIVDQISDSDVRLNFCQRLLGELSPSRGKLYLLRYMIYKYSEEPSLVSRLETRALGLEALLVIPTVQRWEYNHLEGYPEIIVELLLMNGHLDLLGKILDTSEFASQEFFATVDALCEVFAKRALELNNMTASANRRQSMAPLSARSQSSSSFVMPLKIPSAKEWVRDDEISKCMICQTKFSLLVRKHHCRRCGRIVCKECSSRGRLPLEGYGKVPVRVCDDCFVQTTEPEISEATEAVENFTPNTLSKKVSPVKVETTWRLKAPTNAENREFNENTRRVFWYERAPSVSLCLSILDRHSNGEKAAEFILSLCDRLVALLVFPSEIDYGLVIAMLQTLLMKARINLLQQNKQNSLEWCDSYLQTLDLLKLLVKDNCQDLIPKELLTQKNSESNDWMNVHRKLRDRLVEAERFQLAVEISSKCNLEKNVVLAAWGLSLLKAGDWAAAREKLVYCLKKPQDLNNSKSESPLLKDILSILQNATYVGITKAAAVFCALANLKNIKEKGAQYLVAESVDLEVTVQSECWFYLENFASHSSIVGYFIRREQFDRALAYCLDRRCDNDVFIEQVLMPSLRSGRFETLLDAIKMNHNYLTTFSTYLLSSCRYLDKNNFTNTLFRIQIFMEDWVRAAMTSINFFEREIVSLSAREIVTEKLSRLTEAKKHLEKFLSLSISGNTAKSVRLAMPIKEINRHLSTVALQIDVVKFLARREEAQDGCLIYLDSDEKLLPTLFSRKANEKHDLAAMILLNGANVEEGFGLCLRVVQECQLEGMEVLGKVVAYYSREGRDVNMEEIQRLASCVEQSGYNSNRYDMDKVIISVISNLAEKESQDPDKLNGAIDSILKLVKDDMNKIIAYTESGRLRSAYMLAVRFGEVEAVRKIREQATKLHQPSVYKMCDKWLQGKINP
ncbi:uncharacterized protein LOC100907039 [Galendromus occidentalis]|uniref:Uncharacterized protein LOC100907039 n=1 Tax=Galendromus occidentalis TaxID=34638 RepID=A0AAJ7SG80_9ACAR|nr:uncharacterized protein LOC100907039 [Galendromus occidentalis]